MTPLTEDERAQAARIADRLLDEPNADPDDDVRVLARQFGRSQEEIERLRRELADEKRRSFQDGRISYRGFSYGMGSQWGIDCLRRAIERNERG